MSNLAIADLEVFYSVGLSDKDRAQPQRLLLSVDMEFDFTSAAITDRIERTINCLEVAQMLLKFGEGRSWRLIEKVAMDVGNKILFSTPRKR